MKKPTRYRGSYKTIRNGKGVHIYFTYEYDQDGKICNEIERSVVELKTPKREVSTQTFDEISKSGNDVPRTPNRSIDNRFSVGRDYIITNKGREILVRCTQDSPTHLSVIK